MDIYWKVVNLLLGTFRTRPPALKQMLLPPEERKENPLMIQFFTWESKGDENTSWWKHFENEIPRLKELGVTHVWLPPPNKAMRKEGAGYDAYDLWDLGEFDQKGATATRWGSKEELLRACKTAKENDIEIIIDAILNHKLGADSKELCNAVPVDAENRLAHKGSTREIEAWTVYDFPGRGEKYSSMKWNHRHFTGIDWDDKTKTSDIFYIVGPGRKGWSKHVDKQFGNYDYLLGCDIDHTQPDVREDLLRWGSWILETTGASGFRLDAIKHMDRRFLVEFIQNSKASLDTKKLFAVSEYWSADIDPLESYTKFFRGHTAFFDVPLHYKFHEASKAGLEFDLRTLFKRTLVERRPWDSVTFVDNHDTQIGQTLESWVYANFKLQAYALILLRSDGLPCVFYGDLYPNDECYDERIAKRLDQLLKARKQFAYGQTTDYFRYHNCIGFVRSGDEHHPGCAVVLRTCAKQSPSDVQAVPVNADTPTNGDQTIDVRMRVHSRQKREQTERTFRDFLDCDSRVVRVDSDGWASFPCPEEGLAVWVASS